LEKKYIILLAAASVVIGAGAVLKICGVFSPEILLVSVICISVILGALYLFFRADFLLPDQWRDGWSAILAGAIVAWLFVAMHAEFLLWAVALAALFLIQQSQSRIERRLENLEKK
jgi:hypothetical protein